jgi:hypothetical protein
VGVVRHAWVKEEVLTKAAGIIREADLALGRPHDPGRVEPWHDTLGESLFSSAGTRAFRRRIALPIDDDH